MALVLSLKRNQTFMIGGREVRVKKVHSCERFSLEFLGIGDCAGARCVVIEPRESKEVLPDVFISAGRTDQIGQARLVIEAPQSIKIQRIEK